ncbi:hypothetical protein E05_13900 [Plautia stali symbiont]|nr:hypothetical protein E05_13900 [Plautia stali symbiont]
MLDKNVAELSGGEKQRVALLRNLQFLPQILLLDEVTSALEESNKQRVNQLIASLVAEKGLAVIRISHYVQEIDSAERILRLTPTAAGEQHGSA